MRLAMQISKAVRPRAVEATERKGIGHPDSLADLVADEFSRTYAAACLERWGVVLNHWADKVNLVGCAANVGFGSFEIVKPATVHLFGKVTLGVGGATLPLEALLRDATDRVLSSALGTTRIVEHVRYNIENTLGIPADHSRGFYQPITADDAREAHSREAVANDTVLCSAYASKRNLSDLARDLEAVITTPDMGLSRNVPQIGTDVKVALVRTGDSLQATICVPVHADRVSSRADYDAVLAEARRMFEGDLARLASAYGLYDVNLSFNSKDSATSAYICPFGTALGKGDCGVVGRGNRVNGAINVLRPSTGEALAGKNPLNHVGKLYSVAAQVVANECVARFGAHSAEVLLTTDNGRALMDPKMLGIELEGGDSSEADIRALVDEVLALVPSMWRSFVATEACDAFRAGGFRYIRDFKVRS